MALGGGIMMPMPESWSSVRCVFQGTTIEGSSTYEERITLWSASDFLNAIGQAELEPAEYARSVDCAYLGLAQVFQLFEAPGHGTEVFSLMRDSPLGPVEYAATYFATGQEREKPITD
jgi:hypothetical protein